MNCKKIGSISSLVGKGIAIEAGVSVCSDEMSDVQMSLTGFVGYRSDFESEFYIPEPNMNALVRVTTHSITVGGIPYSIMNLVRQADDTETIDIDGRVMKYHASADDIVLERNGKKFVYDNFLCLCRYVNPITGVLSYNLFNPERVDLLKK